MRAKPYTPDELGVLRLAGRKAHARWFATLDMLLSVIQAAVVPPGEAESDPAETRTESAKPTS